MILIVVSPIWFWKKGWNQNNMETYSDKEFVELSEVAIGLENIEKVKSELHRLLVIVPESSWDRSEQSLML